MRRKFQYLCRVLWILTWLPCQMVNSQPDSENGLPFITNYPSKLYQASPQNWSIIQSNQDIMYFANTNGLLEYDGEHWRRTTSTETATVFRSLSKDKDGRIFYGSYNDFGFIARDSTGK